ncbi:MAG: AI-2E family transporter [Pseudonocardia sp.]|nr:AI-2E family transporter [Pseudonocardia sp.]
MSFSGLAPAGALPRPVVVLVGFAAAVLAAAGVYAAAWLVGPVFLALVVVIMVHPVHGRMRRAGLPGWLATAALVLAVYGVLIALSAVLVLSVARLATVLPGYAAEANALVVSVAGRAAELGVGPAELRALTSSLDARRLATVAGGFLLGLGGLLGNLVFLLSLLLFLGIESAGASARMQAVAAERPAVADALRRFVAGTRRFLLVTTIVGLATGLVDTVILALIGVPLALLWGLLVFITNYIPYIGFWIGLVPPVLLALLVGGADQALLVLAVFVVVNFVLTSLVQPKFIGDAVGLSVSVTLVSLVFWAWLLGPLGAVLAVPLTLLVKLLLVDVDPRARWMNALIGTAAKPPAVAGPDGPAPEGPTPGGPTPGGPVPDGPVPDGRAPDQPAGRPDAADRSGAS